MRQVPLPLSRWIRSAFFYYNCAFYYNVPSCLYTAASADYINFHCTFFFVCCRSSLPLKSFLKNTLSDYLRLFQIFRIQSIKFRHLKYSVLFIINEYVFTPFDTAGMFDKNFQKFSYPQIHTLLFLDILFIIPKIRFV